MSEVLNDRDAILQAAAVRIVNPKNASILLNAVPAMFHLNAAGAPDVPEITVTATLLGLEGNVTFEADGAVLTSVTGKSAVVRLADMQGPTAIVRARMMAGGEQFTGACIIGTLSDGASGGTAKIIVLTPSEQVFKVSKTGANAPASITLTATGQNLGGTPSFTIPAGTATLTAGANSLQKILTFANMATDSVTVQVAQDGATDRVTIIKVREGADGQPGADAIVGLLSNETVTLPASSAGVVSSYSGAACTMSVYKGAADDSANWAYAFSPASAASTMTYTASGRSVTVTGLAAGVDTAYVDITASKSGAATITKRFTVTKSRAGASVTGPRGAGHYYVSGSAWADGAADAATPGDNVIDDVVTISSGTFVMEKRWTGAAWVTNGVAIPGNLIVEGSVLGSALKAGTVDIRKPDGTLLLGAGGEFGAQVTARNLVVGSPDNIVPDPAFRDLAWWNQVGHTVNDYSGTNTPWKSGRALPFPSSNGAKVDRLTTSFPMTPGATYRVELQAFISADFVGDFTIAWLIPGLQWHLMGVPETGFNWPDGLKVSFTRLSQKGFQVFSATYTVPDNGFTSASQLRVCYASTAGAIEIGGISITRVADGSLVGDGVLEARHIIGDTLDVLAAKLGDIQLGPNGALRQGAGYNLGTGIYLGAPGGSARFFAGTQGGANIRWSPEEGLRVDKATLSGPEFDPFSVYFSDISGVGSGKRINLGSRTASITGGVGPYIYSWAFVSSEDSGGSIIIANRTSATASFTSAVGQVPTAVTGTVTVTVIDSKGRSAAFTVSAVCDHY